MYYALCLQESSRSHAVFTVIVEHAECDGSGGNIVTIGKLRLVDLAGSERWAFHRAIKYSHAKIYISAG